MTSGPASGRRCAHAPWSMQPVPGSTTSSIAWRARTPSATSGWSRAATSSCRKFWEGRQAYLVQNSDKRVIFINPYQNDLALIGTTDIPYDGRPEDVAADASEIDYLIKVVNRYFKRGLVRDDVVYSFSGVRPLYDDNADNPSAVTRDYIFELDAPSGGAAALRLRRQDHHLPQAGRACAGQDRSVLSRMGKPWTAKAHLPGGDIANADFDRFYSRIATRVRGSRRKSPSAMRAGSTGRGRSPAGRREVARRTRAPSAEFFTNARPASCWAGMGDRREDILERRTKHGLHLTERAARHFADWFASPPARPDDASGPDRDELPRCASCRQPRRRSVADAGRRRQYVDQA